MDCGSSTRKVEPLRSDQKRLSQRLKPVFPMCRNQQLALIEEARAARRLETAETNDNARASARVFAGSA